MKRLQYNGLATAAAPLRLGASLTNVATAVDFNAALKHGGGIAVPTIVAPEYIPLSIVDPTTLAVAEVVWLTAYVAGATTGTIVRGKEGTAGVAHTSGDRVVHGALIEDVSKVSINTPNTVQTLGGIPNVTPNTLSSFALAGGITRYFPFVVLRPLTITAAKLNVQVAGTAGVKSRFGLYEAGANWQPGALVRDWGEFATDAGGIKTGILPGTPDVLAPGRYLLCYRQTVVASQPTLRSIPYTCNWFHNYDVVNNVFEQTFTKTEAYAALPDPGSAWDTVTTSNTPTINCPITLQWTD